SDLKPLVETTIPYDVVEPRFEASQKYGTGKYAWSWLIWQDESCNYSDQKQFIDLAATMGYEYVLVDALWDTQIGRDKIAELSK
ncbi:glycoside hydrolase family 97 protein, partial [Xanthomonas citri pv. citri]|nr:glycoside hydrolase family 97 protein [Xanthomonas citri pv. citri]